MSTYLCHNVSRPELNKGRIKEDCKRIVQQKCSNIKSKLCIEHLLALQFYNTICRFGSETSTLEEDSIVRKGVDDCSLERLREN
jgi:hypothetical protein